MGGVRYRWKNDRIYARRRALLVVVLILLAVFFNAESIQRFFYPLPYYDLTSKYAQVYNLDPCLLSAVIKAESNFQPRAVSKRGARGLMQVMPETGQSVAAQLGFSDFSADQLYIPEINVNIGACYLAGLENEFNGDLLLMLAAYNGGIGNVMEWIGADKSGSISRVEQIPFPETRHYIKKVLRYHKIYSRLYGGGFPL